VVVDRVVAVVDTRCITLSELRRRAAPFVKRAEAQGALPPARRAEIFQQTLQRLVEERLLAEAAARTGVAVTAEEVDRALASIAKEYGKTTDEVLRTASDVGLSEEEYRAELARQILEGKLLQLRVLRRNRRTLSAPEQTEVLRRERTAYVEKLRGASFIRVMPLTRADYLVKARRR
jgi:peptidyl-prolyl cis-trans isomerase SurA